MFYLSMVFSVSTRHAVRLYWVPGHSGVLFQSLLELSQPWESLGTIYEEGLDVGWLTSIVCGGEILMTPKDRLES
jgi:hypothetical protein